MVATQSNKPSGPSRWLAAAAMTLGAWLVAFLIVAGLLSLFADQLKSLPLPIRALVMSGVLVAVMVNLVMPVLSVAVARLLGGGASRSRQRARPSETSMQAPR